ncbi:MAG: GntR family transcriptional regulator [Cyclobacteriaceae bacterium]|nr:GntR family transcriptional regulator [Cyclobacteriaceae bacterium]
MSKYFKISQKIISQIQSGELRPGMRVPSENEIITQHKVSSTTARKALNELEQAGYASKIKGKGTFVLVRNVERTATKILGFSSNMRQTGHKPSTKLLNSKLIKSGYSATINGRWYSMKGPVLQIRRLRFADGIPMMLEERYISLDLCPDIDKQELEGSLYDIYEDKYSLQLAEINQMLSATVITDKKIKSLFKLEKDIPAFFVNGITFCAKEIILEMEESIYRGDEYRFSVKAT